MPRSYWLGRLRLALPGAMALALLLASEAAGTPIIETLPEFSGDCDPVACTVGDFVFTIPSDEVVAAATLAGTFGNSGAASSAPVDLSLDGVLVAQCRDTDPCFDSNVPVSWSYSFAPHELAVLANGMATLTAEQFGGVMVRLGQTTLTVTTVPEPSSGLLLGVGLAALARMRRSS